MMSVFRPSQVVRPPTLIGLSQTTTDPTRWRIMKHSNCVPMHSDSYQDPNRPRTSRYSVSHTRSTRGSRERVLLTGVGVRLARPADCQQKSHPVRADWLGLNVRCCTP